jgi:hypothetical protein
VVNQDFIQLLFIFIVQVMGASDYLDSVLNDAEMVSVWIFARAQFY